MSKAVRLILAIPFVWAMAACAGDGDKDVLDVSRLDETTIQGTFLHGATSIGFESWATADQQRATLRLDVSGAAIDVTVDLAAQTASDDGHLNTLDADEIGALLALRDAVQDQYPDAVLGTLQGKLLARHADWLADSPSGLTYDRREIDLAASANRIHDRADADGCGDDGTNCLWGTDGWDYAVYDYSSDGYCNWQWAQYGEHEPNCAGRCGAGCNHWFDDDYTWDCFDHDKCIDAYGGSTTTGNPNCTDEFWDASDDYFVTYGPWC